MVLVLLINHDKKKSSIFLKLIISWNGEKAQGNYDKYEFEADIWYINTHLLQNRDTKMPHQEF